ncbi:proteophosphoglycan ppg4 [Rhodotorula toruloides]|uniref:Proteophosphoglycan ppg4 n=1 Tax=Rhodotorula toruloides TaxID=5286 RepID=A0A511KJA6_RHOTO|nr:proteophosphoglycan ppg4 [Rhodotorula toruloides]
MSTLLVGAGTGAATALSFAPATVQDLVREYWTAALALVGLCLLAYVTNPGPASFRTHLTSLSFHTHLRRLSSSPSRPPSLPRSPSTLAFDPASAPTNAANGKESLLPTIQHAKRKGAAGAKSTPPSSSASTNRHILSFSNRISLSIRTPSYNFTSYYLFSTVYVPSSRPATAVAGLTKQQQIQAQRKHPELSALLGLGGELWLGIFGRWYALKWWDNEEEERRGRLEKGVKDMVVEDDDKETESPSYSYPPSATVSGSSTPASHPLSHNPSAIDNRTSSPLAHSADSSIPPSPTSRISPAAARLTKRVFRAGQRRSSPTSLTRLKTKAEHAAREAAEAERVAADEAASALAAAKEAFGGSGTGSGGSDVGMGGGKGTTDPVLVELQAQLDELKASAAESEKRLQDELEVLRGKKRDEDTFRAELKLKTKGLEEAKRAADATRVEAEKELNERKAVVKEAQARVDKVRAEIKALERKGIEAVERKEKKKRERKEREQKLRDDVGKKRDELKDKEKGLDEVMHKIADMERKLEVRRALLAGRRAELAQLGVAGMRGMGGPQGGAPMYGVAPPLNGPATATLGGVGAIANAFAAPLGQGGYGRRNYPYVHPLSANNSRPTSIRSGHYDPHTGAFQSAPSSPTLSHPVSPLDDPAPYGNANATAADPASGWPTSFPAAPNGTSHALPHSSFLEHRLQHRAANGGIGDDDLPAHFLPFDFDGLAHSAQGHSPPPRSARSGSAGDNSPGTNANKPGRALALPMQYLDSGLLAGGAESPAIDGPLSPMTPHQTSLIPSQLFHMLDEDDDDDGLFIMPDSPTLRAGVGVTSPADWQGLGLAVDEMGVSRKSSQEKVVKENSATETESVEAGAEAVSPSLLSLRANAFSPALAAASSATTSPLSPPPASPFAPWATSSDVAISTGASVVGDGAAHDLPPRSLAPGITLAHRLSPSQDLDDDLPRAGLSLNPGAKAFAFPLVNAAHARTSSVPSPPSLAASVRTARSGTVSSFPGSSLPSPVGAGNSPSITPSSLAVEPPIKSRMDFAHPSTGPVGSALLSARLSPGFDWPQTTSSPVFAAPNLATSTAPEAAAKTAQSSGFNPFDDDELLGPLR